MDNIKSEAKFFWEFLISLIKTPFILLLFLIGKRTFSEVLKPLHDINEFLKSAKLTFGLICANIAIYITISILFSTNIINNAFIDTYFVSYPSNLFSFKIIPIIGSWFMHAGLGHLFGNMLFLLIFGRVVEKKFGSKTTALIYFGAAIIADISRSLVHIYLWNSNVGAVGASGAISGLVGMGMLTSPFYLTILGGFMPLFLIGWLFLFTEVSGVLYPKGDNISHLAHLGGFFAVTITAFFMSKGDRDEMKKGLMINIGTLLILTLVWFFFFKSQFPGLI